MSSLAAQIEVVANSPPVDAGERRALYDAAKKLLNIVEDPFDTIYRVNNSVSPQACSAPLRNWSY